MREPSVEAARVRRVFVRVVGARVPELVGRGFVERAREYAPGAGDESVLMELDQDTSKPARHRRGDARAVQEQSMSAKGWSPSMVDGEVGDVCWRAGEVAVVVDSVLTHEAARELSRVLDTAARMAESEAVVQRQHDERVAELQRLVKDRETAGDLDGARAALWDLYQLQRGAL